MLPATLGPYRILRELGRGGMGVVYAAEDPRLGRQVALKLLAPGALEPEALLRFAREAAALARVDHPHVLRVHAALETERGPCLVSELIEGESLEALLARGPLEPEQARALVATLADAVAAVHAAGLLHRDLKPSNVLVRPDGAPVLLDFGLARELDARTLTSTGTLLGTPAYMAPEQARGVHARELDARTDVYGLGALLFACLAGRAPFSGPSPFAILEQVLTREPEWPQDAPPALAAIGRAALSKDPQGRPSDAATLARRLRSASIAVAARAGSGARRGAQALALASLAIVLGFAVHGMKAPPPPARTRSDSAPAAQPPPAPPRASSTTPSHFTTWRLQWRRTLRAPEGDRHANVLLAGRWAVSGVALDEERAALRAWHLDTGEAVDLVFPGVEPSAHVWDEARGSILASGGPGYVARAAAWSEPSPLTTSPQECWGLTLARPGGPVLLGYRGGVGRLARVGDPLEPCEVPGDVRFLAALGDELLVAGFPRNGDHNALWGLSLTPFQLRGALGLPFRVTALVPASARSVWVGLREGHLVECELVSGTPRIRRALVDPAVPELSDAKLAIAPRGAATFGWPRAHREGIAALAPAQGGRLLCVASSDVWRPLRQGGELAVWDVTTGELVRRLASRNDRPIVSLAARDEGPGRTLLLVAYRGEGLDLYELVGE